MVIGCPNAIADELLRVYSDSTPPTEAEFRILWDEARLTSHAVEGAAELVQRRPQHFSVPQALKWDQGPFAHQGKAVRAWVDNGFRGTLEMATGSGKTIT